MVVQAQTEDIKTIFDIHHLLGYLVAGFLITVFVMIFYNRLIFFRERDVTQQSKQLIDQLSLIMTANKTEVWIYNVKQDLYKTLAGEKTSEATYSPFEFSQFYDREDFVELLKTMSKMREGVVSSKTLLVKGASFKSEANGEFQNFQRIYKITVSILRKGKSGFPVQILGTQRDITEKQKRIEQAQRTALRYQTIFDSSLVDMIFFDGEGTLLDINDKACESYFVKDRKALIAQKPKYTDWPSMRDIDLSADSSISCSSIIDIKGVDHPVGSLNAQDWGGDKIYFERTTTLLRDKEGHLNGIMMAGRNITDMVISYHRQKKTSQMLERRTHDIQQYIQNINYSLKVSEVRLVNYHPYTHFNMMPITDRDGEVTHYFGMCRNETEMTYTEQKLQEETEKAKEEERLKDMFLLNMSHELRTPLNAVIGFAELYNSEHNEEDEPIFAEEIKKNTGELLALINDILFLSRLDAQMIEYNYQECDFALMFEGWCYMGWSNLQPNVKAVVENPYNRLLVKIDQQNLGTVIQKLCLHSGNTTKEGTVRGKYEYRHGELTITIDDTSKGMSKKEISDAFNRFSAEDSFDKEGTGLDLPIVKELIEQMGGTIEVQSEVGKGTTFFVTLPCEMMTLEKKVQELN